jgi:transposase-like protein
MSVLSEVHFHDEAAAYAWVEARVWPEGRICPHCGSVNRSGKLAGKSTRIGVYKCYDCRKPFTVKVGTVFEASHVKLHIWLQAMFLLCSSKKGISSNQLHRTLGVTLKTAWFISHRIREALRAGDLAVPFGSNGGPVEADETFIGRKKGAPIKRAWHHKMKVLTLIDRERKQAKSVVVDTLSGKTVNPILRQNIAKEARLMTDEATHYQPIGREFAQHGVVLHTQDEYVRGDIHVNTAEGFFSVFKRGMRGIYQHCSERHLHRYVAEFDFRYNHRAKLDIDDVARTEKAIKGIVGKRLTYRTIGGA